MRYWMPLGMFFVWVVGMSVVMLRETQRRAAAEARTATR
jgi:hypothetical protein